VAWSVAIHHRTNGITLHYKFLMWLSKNRKVHREKLKQTRMRGKAQPDGRPALQIIETPFLYFLPLLDQSTRAAPLFD